MPQHTRRPRERGLSLAPAVLLALAALPGLEGCRQQALPTEMPQTSSASAPGSRPVATLGPDEALPDPASPVTPVAIAPPPPAVIATAPRIAARAPFDPARVPESRAGLPPFPLFQPPAGLAGLYEGDERDIAFDREHMIAGDRVVAIEGKVHRQRFRLDGGEREYSALEFQRNYADAVRALGGVEVSRTQYTRPVTAAFGGRDAVDRHYHGTCASDGCENHTYLIRQDGKEYWLQVSTGAIPPHGQIALVQRQAMASALALVDAATMKRVLDTDGRIALQVNFDVDKATLRPDAARILDEITALLHDHPTLRLSIDGHTDASGDAGHNRELSRARADAVRAALIARGIDAARLQARGFGADQPVADNASAEGRARNRRVELVKLG